MPLPSLFISPESERLFYFYINTSASRYAPITPQPPLSRYSPGTCRVQFRTPASPAFAGAAIVHALGAALQVSPPGIRRDTH